MRISDWSSDVCSSDLQVVAVAAATGRLEFEMQIQRASAVERPVHQLLLRGVERFRRPCEAAAYFKHDAIAAQGADDAIQRFLQPALVGWMLRTDRSEERRVWKESVSQGKSRWSPDP